jgi:hypothetical protein
MKRILILLAFVLLLISFVSGEIILGELSEVYNLGDTVSISATIKASNDISGSFNMDLVCKEKEIKFYKNGFSLSYGEELKITPAPSLLLRESIIGDMRGNCKIRAYINEQSVLSREFKISNLIKINLGTNQTIFNPGEKIEIEGEAVRENGKFVEGIVEMNLITDSENNKTENLTAISTVDKGFFLLNISFPGDLKAGDHLLSLKVYEKIENVITNEGFIDYPIIINQIPTNLEIVLEEKEVEPGTNLKVKTILHDQSGEKISSKAIITIKNNLNEILKQEEKSTDEFFEYPIEYNEPPAKWEIIAISNKIKSNTNFIIKEKESVDIDIINETLTVENRGNIPYNNTVQIKIGEEILDLPLFLKVDETKKYKLSAPDGRYDVEIISIDGEQSFKKNTLLTGKSISIKETGRLMESMINPLVWMFIIVLLGLIVFLIFKKGYKKSFFGYISKRKENKKEKKLEKNPLINSRNKAELSLSITGEKQNITLVCIKLKGIKEMIKKRIMKDNSEEKKIKEILQEITAFAEEKKAATYFNDDCLFFLLIPSKTKTFGNEKIAIKISEKAEEILNESNKLFKQKIEFGIAVNYGTIIAKQDKDILKFMSMGTLITTAKKIAGISNKEIFLSQKIKERLGANIKLEKHQKDNIIVYKIKEIKDRDEHKNFIKSFLDRIEKD